MKFNSERGAAIMVVLAGAVWGTIGLFVRQLSAAGLQSMEITTIRCVVTGVVMVPVLLVMDRNLLKIRWRDLWCFFGTGICSIVFFTWCYFSCMTQSSLSVAAILLYTSPIFVTLLSAVLFKEKITGIKLIALSCAFGGCILVSGVGDPISVPALLTGLGAGFGYALYPIFSRYALRRYQPLTVITYTFLIASVGCLLLSDLGSIGRFVAVHPLPNGLYLIAFGVISCVLPYLLYTAGLQRMEASKASILASIEPVVATLMGVVFFQEHITVPIVCGMILVLAAIVLLNRKATKK